MHLNVEPNKALNNKYIFLKKVQWLGYDFCGFLEILINASVVYNTIHQRGSGHDRTHYRRGLLMYNKDYGITIINIPIVSKYYVVSNL
jgi:hypothetical protein